MVLKQKTAPKLIMFRV